jgi:hypothetical protein
VSLSRKLGEFEKVRKEPRPLTEFRPKNLMEEYEDSDEDDDEDEEIEEVK